jgi:protocatechuate 3,4-dioxygenase, alpha subunit
MSAITPSQTVGPFFSIGLTAKPSERSAVIGNTLVARDAAGERIRIEGRVVDGDGRPVNDALLEIWQADAAGRYVHPADAGALPNATFQGLGRAGTDAQGGFWFATIKPGRVLASDGTTQAPHIVMAVFARGMLRQQYTRIYFADDPANADDPVLALVPPDRRTTLLAKPQVRGADLVYGFDVHLQGDNETVFFDI